MKTTRTLKRQALVVVAAGSLALVAACGSDANSGTPASSAPAPATSAPAGGGETTPAAGGETAAAGDPQADLIAAAQAEGKVTMLLGWNDAALQGVGAAFKEKYGIDVEGVTGDDGVFRAQFLAQEDSGQQTTDLMVIATHAFYNENPDLFVPLNEEYVPDITGFDDIYRTERGVIVNIVPLLVSYNTNNVDPADIPVTWQDITNPVFTDNCVMSDPRSSAAYPGWLLYLEEQYTEQFLIDFGNQHCIQGTASTNAQQVAAGAADLAITGSKSIVEGLKADNAPIEWTHPTPVVGIRGVLGVAANAEHPNAAQLFAQYITSTEGQTVLCEAGLYSSLRDGVTSDLCFDLPDDFHIAEDGVPQAEAQRLYAYFGLQ